MRKVIALLQVKGALKALHKIQVSPDLVKVDENHEAFDEELHRDIFVAEQAERMLQEHTKLLLVSELHGAALQYRQSVVTEAY